MYILQADIIKIRAVGLSIVGTEHLREDLKAYVSPPATRRNNTPVQPQSSFVEAGISICRVPLSRREVIRMIGLLRCIFWTLNTLGPSLPRDLPPAIALSE